MIRAMITAHIAQTDLYRLGVIVNGTATGLLSSEQLSNYVVSANREAHLISIFKAFYSDSRELRQQQNDARSLQEIFRKMQTSGMRAFSDLNQEYTFESDGLMLLSSRRVAVWMDREQGLYLLRGKKLFRLQPVYCPENFCASVKLSQLDFYSFIPKKEDLVLCLSPSFISRFGVNQLEEVFSERTQLYTVIQELTETAKTYGFDVEQSWLGIEINETENNPILIEKEQRRGEIGSREGHRNKFSSLEDLPKSGVIRLEEGQMLIPAQIPEKHLASAQKKPPVSNQNKKNKSYALSSIESGHRQVVLQQTQGARERQRVKKSALKSQTTLIERLRDYQLPTGRQLITRLVSKINALRKRWKHMKKWDQQRILVLVLLCFLLLFLFLQLKQSAKEHRDDQVYGDLPAAVETVSLELKALPPEETSLEIPRIIRSNQIQMRERPDHDSALLLNLNRGDLIYQLTEVTNGWIFARAENGVEGYVDESYLKNPSN